MEAPGRAPAIPGRAQLARLDTRRENRSRMTEEEQEQKRQRMLETRRRVQEAASTRTHADKKFLPGQWVYVWRRAALRNFFEGGGAVPISPQ